MPRTHNEFVEMFAKYLDDERAERKQAERTSAAREARALIAEALATAHRVALDELERLRVTGQITEGEYKVRLARLLDL
ncbi:hypothetical protein [Streptomyces sp. NPDC050738]|uniref:hypothetical protein n=1 Tax=Streptomyces sp. NPDC050738 TaxID=3154744 RepID=UPI003420FDDA